MRKNKNKIENRIGERQHQLRKYWTTHENFVTMYDRVYASMVDTKVATPLDESEYYFINISGSRVKTEEEAAGHQINHHLSHPQFFLFGDEVGTDTNQMDDGNNGVQIYIIINGIKTSLIFSKASVCFTFMGMTTATKEPVLCICILALVCYVYIVDRKSVV